MFSLLARERLLLEAARINPAGVDLAAYRRSIAHATRTNGFVDYHSAAAYARRVHQVIESIAALLNDGHTGAVIELTEYALAKLEIAIGEMDDSGGYMSDILPALQDLHHCACVQALDLVTEFDDYVAALRVEYKRKRNFIKLLDRIERE